MAESVLVSIEAVRERDLVEAFLRRMIQVSTADSSGRGESVGMIGILATADDLAGVLAAVIKAAFSEAEAQGVAIVDAEVSGVMEVDGGVRCWGMMEVANAAHPAPMPHIVGMPTVRREGPLVIAEVIVTVAMEEGNP